MISNIDKQDLVFSISQSNLVAQTEARAGHDQSACHHIRLNKNSEFVPTCHHCHIVGHIRPNCPKLRSLSTSKVRPPSRKLSSSKTTHVCHHCSASGHTRPNCFKLFPHKRVSNRSHPLSKGSVPILGELLKALSFLTQF